MTLARLRLLLGISAVGTTVLAATGSLLLELPARLLPTDTTAPVAESVWAALLAPALWTVVLLPFDLLGGLVAVRHRPALTHWFAGWIRGIGVQLLVLSLSGVVLVLASRAFGVLGTSAATALGAIVVLARLDTLTRLGAPMRAGPTSGLAWHLDAHRPDEATVVVDPKDEAFVGGYGGLWRSRLLLPAWWRTLPEATVAALLARRRVADGAPRRRGVLAAVAWVTLGALGTALVLGPPTSAAGLVAFSLGMTLWGFAGLLILPTPSRRAVLAIDREAAREVGHAPLADAITALDRWQDDEPDRGAWIELVFHPVPARSTRLTALVAQDAHDSGAGLWRVARLALPAGVVTWSLLGRAVHCNLGRPALWWMLPGD